MQKIVVKNFRQITSAEIEIKNILFLIGEQASGKSTLAKLIYFFKSLKEDYFNLIYENAKESNEVLATQFVNKIQDKFKVYFGYTSELENDFEIVFYYNIHTVDVKQNPFLKLCKKNNSLNVEFEGKYFNKINKQTGLLIKEINAFANSQTKPSENNYIVLERAKTRMINGISKKVNILFHDDYVPMFFPAGRNITVSYPEQFQTLFFGNLYNTPKSNEETPKSADMHLMKAFILHSKFLYDYFKSNNFDLLINNNEQEFISNRILSFFKINAEYILQGKYDNSDGVEKIVYNSLLNKSVTLNAASSGQQEAIRVIQDLFYLLYENQKSFRIIEEPEAHLYPKAQKKLMELLALVINKTQSQVIITTHSPYVLSILNNLLMYSEVTKNRPTAISSIVNHFGTGNLDEQKNERINILPDEVRAYALSFNDQIYCHSIIDAETGLIGENYLDSITEELNNDFDTLYSLNFSKN
ncbi:AAA family ATPase [Arcicella rosea]|uniref:Putative ATPase n=1 Tax=Arcicella rosea TaxID=502909 RepID=A0A841EMK7_9BACT|nr:AAA family ATPase [Arcicella rosea]MBB6001978.1 putative ATPase [Arcicella rosea]